MRSAGPFFQSRLRGADKKFTIDGDRIAIHDLAMKAAREFNRKGSLAACSRPQNYDEQRIAGQSACTPGDMVPGAGDDEGNNKDDDHYEPEGFKFLPTRLKCVPGSIASQPGHAIIVAEGSSLRWARPRRVLSSITTWIVVCVGGQCPPRNLSKFYTKLRENLMEAQVRCSREILDRLRENMIERGA